MDKPWKRTERVVAARLGGTRQPISGRQRGDVPDIQHDALAIEVKHRKVLPSWLHDAMAQARACRRSEAQLPIVVLHEQQRPYGEAIVCMALRDFEAWHARP